MIISSNDIAYVNVKGKNIPMISTEKALKLYEKAQVHQSQSEIKGFDDQSAIFCWHNWYSKKHGKEYRIYTKRENKHCYKKYQKYSNVCTKCGKNKTTKKVVKTVSHEWEIVDSGKVNGEMDIECQICGLHKDGW